MKLDRFEIDTDKQQKEGKGTNQLIQLYKTQLAILYS
jgi:hypothetical protein